MNPGPTPAKAQCFTPSATWHDVERNAHNSQELRLSTPNDWRIRGIGALFYENYRIQEQIDWFALTALPYFYPIGPPTGYYTLNGSPHREDGTLVFFDTPGAAFVQGPVTSNNPSVRPLGDSFFNDITRSYTQKAVYASVDVDLIPQTLTLTAGTRYFRTEASEVGSSTFSFGCSSLASPPAPNPCVNHSFAYNLNSEGLHSTYSGFKSRANLSWTVTEGALLYYNWSEGFRAGGFNTGPDAAPFNSPLAMGPESWQSEANKHKGFVLPLTFAPDSLTNYELGWKTLWLDRRLQWNGALYQENWNHSQGNVIGPISGGGRTINGGNYRVRGVEMSVSANVAAGLSIEAGAEWNHSELVKQGILRWRDGKPIDFTLLRDQYGPLPNPSGALGSPLAGSPPFQGNLRARYEVMFNSYKAFAQIDAVYQSHSESSTYRLFHDLQGNSIAYELPGFTTYDAALGVGKDAWLVQLYGENLLDTRAQLFATYSEWYKAITVNRPRTIGLRFSYTFSGK